MNPTTTTPAGAPVYVPDITYADASPQIDVQIYPSRIGTKGYLFSNLLSGVGTATSRGGIVSATISKNIRDKDGGKFVIHITPGGPAGVDDPISWTRILTPMSFAIIGLKRGSSQRIVMIGLVTRAIESQEWVNGQVIRTIAIQGFDFTYWFSAYCYYQMAFLGILASNLFTGTAGTILGVTSGELSGEVVSMGYQYLEQVMLGTGNINRQAVLDFTYINYQNQAQFLRNVFGYILEPLRGLEIKTSQLFPIQINFMNSEGAWMDKFLQIFRFPYYEFFIITAEFNDFPTLTTTIGSGGFASFPNIDISLPNYTAVAPLIIARTNPLPWVGIDPVSNAQTFTIDKWNLLPLYALNSSFSRNMNWGFIKSEVNYDVADVANMFMVIPTDSSLVAQNITGTEQASAAELIGVTYSAYSIAKYGYRMSQIDLRWLTAFYANTPGVRSNDLNKMIQVLLGMLSSFYLPSANMLTGQVTIPMWPDVIPGCRFSYRPFKSQDIYNFYIEGVTHQYTFGGPSYTTLDLSRGLQDSVYGNSTLMQALLTDNAVLEDGIITNRTDTGFYPALKYDTAGKNATKVFPNIVGNPTSP